MDQIKAHWVCEDVIYGNQVISHKCYCSNCGYVAMSYSHMIKDFRAGRPFDVPNYNYCPNCGKNMEELE